MEKLEVADEAERSGDVSVSDKSVDVQTTQIRRRRKKCQKLKILWEITFTCNCPSWLETGQCESSKSMYYSN